MNVSTEMKTKPARTGICHPSDSATALASTMPFRINDTAPAAIIAETSQRAGEQGFVNTIFKLRLRRWDETMNRPKPPARTNRNSLSSEKIPRKELKLWIPESLKRAGSELRPVSSRKARANASNKRLRRKKAKSARTLALSI